MSRTMTARSGRAAAREGGATRSTGNAPAIHRVFDCAWGLFLDCAGAEEVEGGGRHGAAWCVDTAKDGSEGFCVACWHSAPHTDCSVRARISYDVRL
jgi:hypothetical protein